MLLAELARDAVDTRWAVRARGHATPHSCILVCGSSRTIVHEPGLTQSAPLLPADFVSSVGAQTPTTGDQQRPPVAGASRRRASPLRLARLTKHTRYPSRQDAAAVTYRCIRVM